MSPWNFLSTQTSLTNVLTAKSAKKKEYLSDELMSTLFIFTQTNNKLTLTCQENMQTAALHDKKQNTKCLNEQLGQSQATSISRY